MKGDVSFVASIIYAAIVIIAIAAIASAVLSVFAPASTFEKDSDSFRRWLETLSPDTSAPYSVTIDEEEAFVLGYARDCRDSFERLDARCAEDELCLCLQRVAEGELEEVRCVGDYVSMSVDAGNDVRGAQAREVPGGCASSHAPRWWTLQLGRDRPGIYVFTPDFDTNVITVSRRG